MRAQRNQESLQMYLETILKLSLHQQYVHSIEIANAMGFSKPSVSIAMKNLKEQGYITVDSDSHIHLTDAGRKIAVTIYERHLVLTKFFEALGIQPDVAEEDACRIEHFISAETFQAIRDYGVKQGLLKGDPESELHEPQEKIAN